MLVCLVAGTSVLSADEHPSDRLYSGFVTPPDSVRTGHFWYWMSDNISKDGVVEDLKAMKKAGIGLAYIGFMGPSDHHKQNYPFGNVKFMTPEWWDVLHTALKTATELGIDIGIFNSPGWSQSGGPWVKPEETMRHLAASRLQVEGPNSLKVVLDKPDSLFQDVKVLAFKGVRRNLLTEEGAGLTNQGDSIYTYSLPEENIVRSVMVYPGDRLKAVCEVQVKEPDGTFRTLKRFGMDCDAGTNLQKGFDQRSPVTESLSEVAGREFRFVVIGSEPGSRIDSLVLSPSPVIPRYPGKVFAKIEAGSETCMVTDSSLFINPQEVMDISAYMDDDDVLTWNVPDGAWTILRTGMVPTGVKNSPATPEATGYEADKMSREIIQRHFRSFLGEIYERIPAEDRLCWKYTVLDSYEKGGQNITDGMIGRFRNCFGYDPTPFFPTYYGYVVGSNEISERFLWDMRRFVADEIAYQYVSGLREVSHEYGLRTWLENYGHGGFSAEFLQYGGQSDEVSGELWHAQHRAEKRAAASCAHIYGKPIVWCESFTNDGRDGSAYAQHPAMLKKFCDDAFAQGVNSMLLHVYIQQYANDDYPGVDGWFGTEFNRKNTLYQHLDLFVDYIRRCSFMLQQGRNVADVAYYIGEDTPVMTGQMYPSLPDGYQYDFINAEVLLRDAFAEDGMLCLHNGQRYRVLALPPKASMRPEVLNRISQLVSEGVTVVGPAPVKSPSLQNYPACDEEIRFVAGRLWDDNRRKGLSIPYGYGNVVPDATMQEVLDMLGVVPDCLVDGKVEYAHRILPDGIDIYFLSNQRDEAVRIAPEFRVSGRRPERWSAVDGTVCLLSEYSDDGVSTSVPLMLQPYESAFIVFRRQPTADAYILAENIPEPSVLAKINGRWTVSFQSDRIHRGPASPVVTGRLSDLSKSGDEAIRYYSGAIRYENTFRLKNLPEGRVLLEIDGVGVMAKVKVNDRYVGGVWAAPYRVDISDAVKKGTNKVEIEVVNTWLNRILGDLRLPEQQRILHPVTAPWNENTKLQPSGLMGTVRVITM